MALSDAWLKANHRKEQDKPTEKTDREGLSVRLSKTGRLVFQLRYRRNGKAARVDLGTYPTMTLKAARTESARMRAALDEGKDPRAVRKLERISNAEAPTVEQLFDRWFEQYASRTKQHAAEIKRRFEIHIFPTLGALPCDDIPADVWLDTLDAIAQKKAATADSLLSNTKQLLSWGQRRHLVANNVLGGISARRDLLIKKKPRARSLDDVELANLIEALECSRMAPKNKLFVFLCLLFGCRNGELRLAERAHFDLAAGIWTVPPDLHKTGAKTGDPIVRPIIPRARVLIELAFDLSAGRRWLFTCEDKPEPMGARAPLSLPYNLRQWLRRHREYEMGHWSMHDLRRTARTNFSTLTEPHVAEIMLGHKLPGVWQTYDRHTYLDEQRAAYEAWADRLEQIAGGPFSIV